METPTAPGAAPSLKTKVYLLGLGQYSDFHIFAVYSTREKAEAMLARIQQAVAAGDGCLTVVDKDGNRRLYSEYDVESQKYNIQEFEVDGGPNL